MKLSTSPQSTLCGFKPGSRGSPKSGSGVCSPPEAKEALDLELLYAAAGEVARLQMIEDTAAFYYAKQLAPPSKPASVPVPPHNPSLAPGFYTNQSQRQTHHSYEQLHAAKVDFLFIIHPCLKLSSSSALADFTFISEFICAVSGDEATSDDEQ